jgi:hypothetical protein
MALCEAISISNFQFSGFRNRFADGCKGAKDRGVRRRNAVAYEAMMGREGGKNDSSEMIDAVD